MGTERVAVCANKLARKAASRSCQGGSWVLPPAVTMARAHSSATRGLLHKGIQFRQAAGVRVGGRVARGAVKARRALPQLRLGIRGDERRVAREGGIGEEKRKRFARSAAAHDHAMLPGKGERKGEQLPLLAFLARHRSQQDASRRKPRAIGERPDRPPLPIAAKPALPCPSLSGQSRPYGTAQTQERDDPQARCHPAQQQGRLDRKGQQLHTPQEQSGALRRSVRSTRFFTLRCFVRSFRALLPFALPRSSLRPRVRLSRALFLLLSLPPGLQVFPFRFAQAYKRVT